MTFKAFIFGLLASFGFPWLVAVVIPFAKMRSLEPVKFAEGSDQSGPYIPARDGRVTEGSKIYGQEGCATCHTQVIRPTYAGNDIHREGWAGLQASLDNPDTRRATFANDFRGEKVAHIGMSRVGPDLANLGRRLETHLKGDGQTPLEWVMLHLYNPRSTPNYADNQTIPDRSSCPSKNGLFNVVPDYQGRGGALKVEAPEGKAVVPTDRARALASYLVSLKKDMLNQPVPASLNANPKAAASAK